MTVVWGSLSSETFGNTVENVERAVDADLATNATKYLGPVRVQRYNATTFALLSEIYIFESTAYATEPLAEAAWQA